MPAVLDPSNVELHGLTESDWLKFAYNYARLVNYYKDEDPAQPSGDWQHFFDPENRIDALLKGYGEGDTEPHMALFISFLKLLVYPQKQLNELPKRHLDFYYREVLQIRKKPLEPDRVHVLFELAKNASDEFLDTGTSLSAGKDSNGKPLIYDTTTPLVINQAKVASIKSVYTHQENGSEVLRHAPSTKTADGLEEELEDGESWSAFGNKSWPDSQLAFYIASDLLLLKEGTRTISLKFKLRDGITIAQSRLQAFLTGEKEWLEVSKIETVTETSNFIINLEADSEMDPITAYDEEAHTAGLPTSKPALKIVFMKAEDYGKLKNADISNLKLEVHVIGATSLELKNELGNIDPEKPFMPFGSRPKVGSRLSVNYSELEGKPVSDVEFEMRWLNTPANFSEHYSHYLQEIKKQKESYADNSSNFGSYMVATYYSNPILVQQEVQFLNAYILEDWSLQPGPPPDTLKNSFKAQFESPYGSKSKEFELFSDENRANDSGPAKKVANPKMSFILKESFYHDLYSKIYVNAVLTAPDKTEADLPNEPYTPLLDRLTMNYTAYENISFSPGGESSSVMYHQHPFGVKQATGTAALVPDYSFSELYVGLEGMKPGSNISLLFQVAEGTEDPLLSTFEEGDIDWWALSDNQWVEITKEDFARDQTHHFLRSGIAEVALPKVAGNQNTLLPKGLHWLRIRLKKKSEAVCRFINIHAQAAEALFHNKENSVNHLKNGLPSQSIDKLLHSRSGIKSVSQPYPGFGGAPEEEDSAYYRRVSERLRHKNRAVSIWDYEHLVLEQFPSLYRVKCLNHSHWNGTDLDEMSPGNVTLVLIPKLAEDNTNFRLEPRVSRNFMDEVEEFLNQHSSKHADLKAVNAVYEPVRFEFEVEFKNGLDFNYHKKRIIDDLKRMVAPWVFDEDAAIEFGGSFSEYEVVHYIENLSYVDYISNFKMFHKPADGNFSQKPIAKPSIPMAILVPVFDEQKINETPACG